MHDIETFIAGLHDYIGKALRPLAERLKTLEDRAPEKGDPGKDADPAQVALAVAVAVADAVAALPSAPTLEDVRPLIEEAVRAIPEPKNGKDADPEAIALAVAEAMKALPPPTPVTIDDMRPVIEDAVKALPLPKDGKDGATADEIRELVAEAIKAIPPPKDGESVTVEQVVEALAPAVEAKMAAWALDFERRAQGVLERAVDRIPKPVPGKDGLDGLGFDDMQVIHDGERGFTLRFARGERVREMAFTIPCVLDRGVYKDGTQYAQGDGTTWAGSYWIAQATTKEKPGTGADWRLAVKRGRDGKDFIPERA